MSFSNHRSVMMTRPTLRFGVMTNDLFFSAKGLPPQVNEKSGCPCIQGTSFTKVLDSWLRFSKTFESAIPKENDQAWSLTMYLQYWRIISNVVRTCWGNEMVVRL